MEKMKTLLIGTIAAVTTATTAFAGPHGGHHGGYHHHGHHSWWGRGGCHFWPGFIGGFVGSTMSRVTYGYPTRVVYTTPVYTTPTVVTQPTVITTPVVTQPVITQPTATEAKVIAPEVKVVATEVAENAQEKMTTVYIDTNGCKWVEGTMKVDSKGRTVLPNSYIIKHINDIKQLQRD